MEWFLKFRENQYDEQQAAFSGTSSARTTAGPSGRIHWLFPCSTWNTSQSELAFSPPLPDPTPFAIYRASMVTVTRPVVGLRSVSRLPKNNFIRLLIIRSPT